MNAEHALLSTPPRPPIGPEYPWLAPLAGFSDLPFRLLCREMGAAVACTEMISAKGLVFAERQGGKAGFGTRELLATVPEDAPLVVQLFGAEPEYLSEAVALLQKEGFVWFDLNMGCSVPKVTKTGAGAALLRDVRAARRAAEALITAAGPGRAGIKMRLGWEIGNPVYLELAKAFEEAGAAWLTLHPRFALQKFSGSVDIEALARLTQTVSIPVIAGGDLFRAQDGIDRLAAGTAGVMFARGAMNNPAIFRQYLRLLGNTGTDSAGVFKKNSAPLRPAAAVEPDASNPLAKANASATRCEQGSDTLPGLFGAGVPAGAPADLGPQELHALIRKHAELARTLTPGTFGRKGLTPGLLKMRTVVPRYVRGLPGAKHLRKALTGCESWEHLERMLEAFFHQGASPS